MDINYIKLRQLFDDMKYASFDNVGIYINSPLPGKQN